VLICCAHSDDCVITGAEYAYGVVQSGLTVRIFYLTCSAPNPNAQIAKIRKAEALTAWSALGVPTQNCTFIDLNESPVFGPITYSDQDVARAREILSRLLLSMPKNAAVIIPAEGESHVDHKTVRKVSLLAIADSKRKDIVVYETPEYNGFLSLVHCPKRTIRAVFLRLPLLNRVLKPYVGPSHYVNGAPGLVFRDTPKRLAKKKELLTYFSSQGPKLVQTFGHETPYRMLSLPDCSRDSNTPWCVPAFEACCDASVLAFGLSLLGVAFLTAHQTARSLAAALAPALSIGKYLCLLGALVAFAYVVRRIRGTVNFETSLFVWTISLGVILGSL
jgi:LmbE family N-acetylglucosaminyl deacetylase